MAKSSEFHAYNFIKNELLSLGWNVYNPTRRAGGEVYTQNECLQNTIIKSFLGNLKPENIVVVRVDKFWVIEAKPMHKDIDAAVDEVKEYANKLNTKNVYAPLITAVAGNDEDTYLIKSFFFYKGKWVPIEANGKVLTGLLPKDIARFLVDNNTYKTEDFNLPDELYLAKAKNINEILHLGSINKNNRAKVISALLLSMLEDTPLNLDNPASSLIAEINSRVDRVLYEHGKREFAPFVQITVPPTPDNHVKFRKALIDTAQELKSLNIRSAMNSGTDILGRFYEAFLKYGNGAKEIGIVLTPRHITKFAAEVLSVNRNDIIFDPACGTGGFLVSAFDYVKKQTNQQQLESFKKNNIYGFEQEPEVVALALVNMIFRGDGNNNIVEGNSFVKKIPKLATKVLMNPPFALKKDDEKEYKFIDNALSQMEDDGLLFVIIPSTIMFKGKQLKIWRETILRDNTLEAVIKLPEDLFYPVAVHTSAVIIKKGVSHKKDKTVFWGYLVDGYIKKKGIMKPTDGGDLDLIKSAIIDFLNDSKALPVNNPKKYTLAPVLFDTELECAPEYYIKAPKPTLKEIINGMESILANLFHFLMNSDGGLGDKQAFHSKKHNNITTNDFDKLFFIENAKSDNIEDYSIGTTPFITSTELNNGVEKFIDPNGNETIYNVPCVALSSFGFATVQIPPFVARSHGAVLVLRPKIEMNLIELSYFAAQINLQKWRFSYGRWVTKKRLLKIDFQSLEKMNLPELDYFTDRLQENFSFAMKKII